MLRIILTFILFLTTTLLSNADDFTLLVADGDLPYSTQSWFYCGYGNKLNEPKIKKYWDDGYRITSAAYTDCGWFIVMSKGSGIGAQSYRNQNLWPNEWIDEKWRNGYQMTQCSVGAGEWLIVMSKGTGITAQVANYDTSTALTKWIKEKWNEGYEITITAPKDNKWYVVMSKNSGLGLQTFQFFNSYTAARNFIKEKWEKEYYLTQMTQNASGEYFCVMSHKEKSVKESYTPSSDNVTEWINTQWKEGKDIAYVCGGYKARQATTSSTSRQSRLTSTSSRSTNTNNNTTTARRQQNSSPKTYREELGYGMFAIVTKYSEDTYMKSLYAPCSICHGTTKCGNCFGYGRCKSCHGTGNMYHGLNDYFPCPLCNGTGICSICKGSGVCPCATGEYPGFMLSNVLTVSPDNVFSTATHNTSNRNNSSNSSRTDGQTYSRSNCPKCGGTGVDPTPYENTYNGYSSFLAYTNSAGNKCPYCGRYTSHHHEKCSGCNVPTY